MTAYDAQAAGVQCTLASIAYDIDTTGTLHEIKQAMILQLAKEHYATGGEWKLAFGPVIGSFGDNLVYVARHKHRAEYSVVLRGTVGRLASFWEDVPTSQEVVPFIPDEQKPGERAKASTHFLEGLAGMLEVAEADTGLTLTGFLQQAIAADGNLKLTVTGHSQGGGLTPIALAWLKHRRKRWDPKGHARLGAYAFAPPTSGDPAFAGWVDAQDDVFLVINPLDLVPYGYAWLDRVARRHIPTRVPWLYYPLLWMARFLAWRSGPWEQPSSRVELDRVQIPAKVPYMTQVSNQHNHNSYLYLLGAAQTDVGDKSVLPGYRKS